MSITIDKKLCVGCGLCASICPSSFKMNDGGKAEAINQKSDCIKDASESCPTQAIKIK